MADVTEESECLSWAGALLILGIVGLNTAFTLRAHGGPSVSLMAVETWLPDYGVRVGLGLLVTAGIVSHVRVWKRS